MKELIKDWMVLIFWSIMATPLIVIVVGITIFAKILNKLFGI